MNEITFKRSLHDKKNPYVMVSREMAQDKSISLKARGLLLYLLSLPDDWQIYHSQLQQAIGCGEDYINSAMEELLENGYAERTRERVGGMYQPYQYTIFEFKISLPNGENQPGSTGPVNPDLHNTYSPYGEQKKQQQAAAPAAAVFSESLKEEKQDTVIFDSLKEVEIPQKDKVEISARYEEEAVKNAISWALSDQTKITKGLAPAIKWACQNKPEVPRNKNEEIITNKSYALRYDGLTKNNVKIDVCLSHVEFVYVGCQKDPTCLSFDEKGFMEQFKNLFRKHNFNILE